MYDFVFYKLRSLQEEDIPLIKRMMATLNIKPTELKIITKDGTIKTEIAPTAYLTTISKRQFGEKLKNAKVYILEENYNKPRQKDKSLILGKK